MADNDKTNNNEKAAPASAHGTPRFVVVATICAAILSSAASLIAISSYMKRPTEKTAPAPSATPSPAPAVASAEKSSRAGAAPRERIKEFWSELTPEQREHWKRMNTEERKEFILRFEQERRAPSAAATPAATVIPAPAGK